MSAPRRAGAGMALMGSLDTLLETIDPDGITLAQWHRDRAEPEPEPEPVVPILGKILGTTAGPPRAWTARAACAGIDPDLLHPGKGESCDDARAVCAGCEVRADCLDYALDTRQKHGVWGGLAENERRTLRRRRRDGAA